MNLTNNVTHGTPIALTTRPAWAALLAHHAKIGTTHLRELFATDANRGNRFTLEAAGLYLDYSKNRITEETPTLLIRGAPIRTLKSPTSVSMSSRHASAASR